MIKSKLNNIGLIFLLWTIFLCPNISYASDTFYLRTPLLTQDEFQEKKILMIEIAMAASEYREENKKYPALQSQKVFPKSIKDKMNELGVKVFREVNDCLWIYSEEDNYYMRLSKLSSVQFISHIHKDIETEVLTREAIERVERAGVAIRVFKGHDLGGIFKIFNNLLLASQRVDSIALRLDENTEHFREELKRMHSSLARESYDSVAMIVQQQAILSKEGTLTFYAADKAINTLEEVLDNLEREKVNLEKIYREFKELYKGKEDLSSLFEEFFKYMDAAIKIMQSRVEIATGKRDSYLPYSISDVIEDICTGKPTIKIENNVPEDMLVSGNLLTLINAFVNLINNATQFAREKVRVVLTEENGYVRIDIIDDGEGISERLLKINPITGSPLLFSINASDREGGTGLGTTDAWYAVKDHGGNIEVVSKIGKGTTFTVTLPISEQAITWQPEWGEASGEAMQVAEMYMKDWDSLKSEKPKPGMRFQMMLINGVTGVKKKYPPQCPKAIEIFKALCKINFDWGACLLMTPYSGYHHTVEHIIDADYDKPYMWALLKRGIELSKNKIPVKCINKVFNINYDTTAFMHAYLIISEHDHEAELMSNLNDEAIGFLISGYYLYWQERDLLKLRTQKFEGLQKELYKDIVKQRPGIIEFLSDEASDWLGLLQIDNKLPSKDLQKKL